MACNTLSPLFSPQIDGLAAPCPTLQHQSGTRAAPEQLDSPKFKTAFETILERIKSKRDKQLSSEAEPILMESSDETEGMGEFVGGEVGVALGGEGVPSGVIDPGEAEGGTQLEALDDDGVDGDNDATDVEGVKLTET